MQMAKQRKKISAKKPMSIADQEKVLEQLHKKDAVQTKTPLVQQSKGKKVQRVTVDFPVDIYEQMKEETENKGHTLKWFIVNLVKKHLKEQE